MGGGSACTEPTGTSRFCLDDRTRGRVSVIRSWQATAEAAVTAAAAQIAAVREATVATNPPINAPAA